MATEQRDGYLGTPSVRKKDFFIEKVGDPAPYVASVQSYEDPLAALGVPREPKMLLRLPDESEWLVDEAAWEQLLAMVRASREFYAGDA